MDPRVGELQQVIMKKDSMILHLQKQLAIYQRKFGTINDSYDEVDEIDQRESLSTKNNGSILSTTPTKPSSPVHTTTRSVRKSISSPSLALDLPTSVQVTTTSTTPTKPAPLVNSSTPLSPTIVSKKVGKNVILDFVEDSPMFRRELEGFDESMHGLKTLLKEILSHTKEYVSAGTRFGDEESTLVEEIANKKYARALFTTSCPELDSLSSVVNQFHDTITQMQSSRVSMLLSIDALLHHSISRFLEHELKDAYDMRKEVIRLSDEYEAALGKLFSKSKQQSSSHNLIAGGGGGGGSSTASILAEQFNTSFNLALSLSGAVTPTGGSNGGNTGGGGGSSSSSSSNSSNGSGTPGKSIEKETFQLRLKFELARYDLVHFINRLESQKKFILTECFTSTLYAMLSHFHACHELIKSVEPELRRRQEALTKSRQDFDQDEVMWAEQRDILEKRLREDLDTFDFGASKPFDLPLEILSNETLASRTNYKSNTILKEGYLFVRSTMFPVRNWKRKWFQIHSGKLYHNRGKHMDVSLVCDLMLSKVRECPQMNLPFCFEVIDASQAKHLLQATSEMDMQEWIEAARKSTESMLEKQSHRMSVHPEQQKFIQEIIAKNVTCADCDQTPAEWVSINLGVFLCIECSGIHRSLGSHVSKVRSLTLDSWEMPLLTLLRDHLGNEVVNSFWEHTIPNGWTRPNPTSSRDTKSKWIKEKYISHGFAEPIQCDDALPISRRFLEAASHGNFRELIWCVAHGAEVKTIMNENLETALHLSAAKGASFCCDYLLLNGASLNAADKNGKLPFDAAKTGGHESIKLSLMQKMSVEQQYQL